MTDPQQRAVCAATLGFCWIYHGVVPKLLFRDSGEMEIFEALGIGWPWVLTAAGVAEILFGAAMLIRPARILFLLNLIALPALAAGALIGRPALYTEPFNPASTSMAMMAVAWIGYRVNLK